MRTINLPKKSKIKHYNLLTFLAILASFFLIYNILLLGSIEAIIRIIIIFVILIIDLVLIRKNNKQRNKKTYTLFMTLFIILNITVGISINKMYNLIDKINKEKIIYSTSLITKKEGDLENLDDIVNKKIGILNDTKSIDNYVLAQEIIQNNDLAEDNEIILYEDLTDMIHELYQDKIDCIFISSNYKTMFQTIDEYKNIDQETKILTTSEKSIKKENTINYIESDGKNITQPFTILLMGVDSEKDGMIENASNGDSLILISFNPYTLNTTMLSIPRDSYVPIACFKNNRENKITHAGWYGASCMIDTIENLLDVNIDYYLKINFKGVVSLVDILGGVTVNVPKDLCTDNSNRTEKVCIKQGIQTLNGEEALVLARNRYDLTRGDLDRANNQQLLLKAMLESVKNINSISKVESILNTISKNIDTNMTTNQILSLYNIAKDIIKIKRNSKETILPIEKLILSGDGQMIYDNQAKLTMWNYIINEKSLEEVKEAIKKNLENNNMETNFNYSTNENYISKIIGTGPYTTTSKYTLLPSFIGKNKNEVEEFTKKYNIKVEFTYVEEENNEHNNDTVIYQNYIKNTRIDEIDTLKINILKNKEKEKLNCTSTENKNEICLLPSFIGKTKTEVENYFKQYENDIKIIYNEVMTSLYPGKKIGIIVGQNYKVNTHLAKIKSIELTIISE